MNHKKARGFIEPICFKGFFIWPVCRSCHQFPVFAKPGGNCCFNKF
uniref:Uncharacterized protein n=1 Tax=Klebsiella pneumoniae TaxID=573 RepID=A0A455TK86_KLEPN|nr:hypothetical protein [Klebsiella pneumoniae]BBI29586.1 hypothetical protein [Klebsiella pneumoniae]